MAWWIPFVVAMLGWGFTIYTNYRTNQRNLTNQLVISIREKLTDIIDLHHEMFSNVPNLDSEQLHQESEPLFVHKIELYKVEFIEFTEIYTDYKYFFRSFFLKKVPIIKNCKYIQDKYSSFMPKLMRDFVDFHVIELRQELTNDQNIDYEQNHRAILLQRRLLITKFPLVY